MSCDDVARDLEAYVDRELDARSRRRCCRMHREGAERRDDGDSQASGDLNGAPSCERSGASNGPWGDGRVTHE